MIFDFRFSSPDALRPHKKGRKKTLGKSQKNTNVQACEEKVVDTSVKHIKESMSRKGNCLDNSVMENFF